MHLVFTSFSWYGISPSLRAGSAFDVRFSFSPQLDWSTEFNFITGVCTYVEDSIGHRIDQTSRLLSVLGTVYKVHPTDWWHTHYHGIVTGKKSPQINKYTCSDSRSSCQWCAYTSYILLICWIIVKLNAINSLKYSPKIITKTFCHSDCCSIRKLWAFTAGHYLLIFSIIANKDAIKFVIFTKNLSNSRRKMVIAKARPSIWYCHSSTFVNLWMRLLYLCVILELIEKTLSQCLYRNSKVEFNTFFTEAHSIHRSKNSCLLMTR